MNTELYKMPETKRENIVDWLYQERKDYLEKVVDVLIASGIFKSTEPGIFHGRLCSGRLGRTGRPKLHKPEDILFEGHSPCVNDWYRQLCGRGFTMSRSTFMRLRKDLISQGTSVVTVPSST